MNYEQSRAELKHFISCSQKEELEFNIWAVITKEDLLLIGLCGYYKNNNEEYEIAFRLRKSFWGKGFGLEMTQGLLHYLSQKSHIKSLVAYAANQNKGSLKILRKLMIQVDKPSGKAEHKFSFDISNIK